MPAGTSLSFLCGWATFLRTLPANARLRGVVRGNGSDEGIAMKPYVRFALIGVLIAVGSSVGARGWAQSAAAEVGVAPAAATASAVDPEAARQAALEAAEDLTLTRVIAGLRLTRAQLERLLPHLEAAAARLKAQEEEARAALLRPQPLLEETRRALIAGRDPSTRAEGQIAEQMRVQTGKIRQLRADLTSSLRRTLGTILTADQQALLAQTARTLDAQWRSARFTARAVAGGRDGDRGGGPLGWMGRALDRARGASEANYPRERLEIALRLSGLGGRGWGPRDQEQPQVSPDDPQLQQRLAPLLALIDRTRQMPDAQYQQARPDLALQIWAQRAALGLGAWGASNPDAEINGLIDRYFLSPRMIPIIRERIASR